MFRDITMGTCILLVQVGVSYSFYFHFDTFSLIFVKAGNSKQTEQKKWRNKDFKDFFSLFLAYHSSFRALVYHIYIYIYIYILLPKACNYQLSKSIVHESNLMT